MFFLYMDVELRLRGESLAANLNTLVRGAVCFKFMRKTCAAGVIQPIGNQTVLKCTAVRMEVLVDMTSAPIR